MIFIDSSAWYAAYVPSDPHHESVLKFVRSNARPIITSNFIVDETITLLLARRERRRAIQFGNDVLVNKTVRLESVTVADLLEAYNILVRFSDKLWSFTDCTSYAVMRRLGINTALALDADFQQMPGVAALHLEQ
ncbi:MAG: PIN domain-containing protein [Pirellulales bacterium]